MSDAKILWGIALFFIVSGLTVSWVNTKFNTSSEDFDTDNIIEESKTEFSLFSAASLLRVLLEIAKMSFWTFGSIPALIDLIIYVPVRLIFWFLIVRNALGSGG